MTQRVYNFSPGPAALPEAVLAEVQRDLMCLPGVGASILEISHRSKAFEDILHQTQINLRQLLSISDEYAILFLQGGSRLQFSMVPMNLLGVAAGGSPASSRTGGPPVATSATYIVSGTWGKYASKEAAREGEVSIAWDGGKTKYDRLPGAGELNVNPNAKYAHFTSNETIEGVQFKSEPATGSVPLVCDASSDFLSRPINVPKYGMIYACAQKNAGPAGVTVVILRKGLLAQSRDELPGYLNYKNHADNDSLWNTPPTFAIYVVSLVTKWLLTDIAGLAKMQSQNEAKAKLLYDVVDGSNGFYTGHAQPNCRSVMNVVFRLPSEELTKKFTAEAAAEGLTELKGHRSVGGIRASIYNAMPVAGVEKLRDFMIKFKQKS